MKKVCRILSLILFLFVVTIPLSAQVTIGDGVAPNPDAVLDLISNDTKGLLLPRIELESEVTPAPLSQHVAGMVIFNTGPTLTPGYYYNNGERWVPVADGNSVTWNNTDTQAAATSNTQNIYQMGTVTVGGFNQSPNTQFEVNSSTRGMLTPRMTTAERNAITGTIPNGLFIFNTTTNCFNYYNGSASLFRDGNISEWISLCGTYDPSSFELLSCDPPTGPSGSLTQGTSLGDLDTYSIIINVAVPGTYQIVANTTNGYSFSDSGTFHESGTYTLVLKGQGTPRVAGTDAVSVRFNGVLISPSCPLPTITIDASITTGTITCTPSINGTYLRNTVVNPTNYVDIPVVLGSVTNPGSVLVTTNTVNGIYFSTGSVPVDGSTTSLRFFAQGTPQNVGTNLYTFTVPGNAACNFNITTATTLGTFANPSRNCLAILNEDPSSTDNEYWIQAAAGSGGAVKTFCDMTHGGYTLIWSYSEKTSYTIYTAAGIQNTGKQLTSDLPYNVQNALPGVINYNNHRLARATMQNAINSSLGIGQYRIRIANTSTDMNDAWGNDNYMTALPTDKTYDYINSSGASWVYPGTQIPFEGRIFGYVVDGTVNPMTYNGVNAGLVGAYFGNTGYGAHLDAGGRLASASLTVSTPIGPQTFNPNTFNNLFGFFGELESNHLFGKCVNSTETLVADDDYTFTIPTCWGNSILGSGVNHLVPHSFNGGEGRVLQWFVK